MVSSSEDREIVRTIKDYIKEINETRGTEQKFRIADEMFYYLYVNRRFINKYPKFRGTVYERLIRFEVENISEYMKSKLKYHKNMLFPEPEIPVPNFPFPERE